MKSETKLFKKDIPTITSLIELSHWNFENFGKKINISEIASAYEVSYQSIASFCRYHNIDTKQNYRFQSAEKKLKKMKARLGHKKPCTIEMLVRLTGYARDTVKNKANQLGYYVKDYRVKDGEIKYYHKKED